jgi:CBS domain-containing protein
MSPRAAWRLESLGFQRAYDYVAGKADWFAAGLPREGARASVPRAADAARTDAASCRLGERVRAVADRVRAAGQEECLVLNDHEIVLGRLRGPALEGNSEPPVEDVMEAGPTTIRPDVLLDAIVQRLRSRGIPRVIVSTSDGRLIGTLYVDEAERRLEEEESCLC